MTDQERHKKRQEQFKLQSRYLRDMHTRIGLLWEIPRCCIDQFVEETIYGIHSHHYRTMKHQKEIPPEIEYVPCDNCMKNL